MKRPIENSDKTCPLDLVMDENDFLGRSRTKKKIELAANELREKVWYIRHLIREKGISEGSKKITEAQAPILARARAAARRIEADYGAENLELDDFEWAMMQGRMSALRWVLGSSWKCSLDT